MAIDPTRPTYFFNNFDPLAACATDSNMIRMIEHKTGGNTGSVYADLVCDEIQSRGLLAGEICIDMKEFGIREYTRSSGTFTNGTSLWQANGDKIKPTSYNEYWCPFFDKGINDNAKPFINAFVTQYKARQTQAINLSETPIPDPTAFAFDYEQTIQSVHNHWTNQWADFKADARWSTEEVSADGRTWSELVTDESIVDPAVLTPAHSASNAAHHEDVQPWLLEAQSVAMDKAAYQPLLAAWPNVICGNWITSHDGYHGGWSSNPAFSINAQGTHQCPSLYSTTASAAFTKYNQKIRPGTWSQRPYAPWIAFTNSNGGPTSSELAGVLRWQITEGIRDGIEVYFLWGDGYYVDLNHRHNVFHGAVMTAEANV